MINEFSVSTRAHDVEYVELLGSQETDLSGYTLLEVEGDARHVRLLGLVDEVFPLGTTMPTAAALTPFLANALENGTL